jgi:hypothetical protein
MSFFRRVIISFAILEKHESFSLHPVAASLLIKNGNAPCSRYCLYLSNSLFLMRYRFAKENMLDEMNLALKIALETED